VHASLAMRIQTFCEPGRVLVCKDTAELVGDAFACRQRMEIPVKYLPQPVPLYELGNAVAA
jgi:class 3 adenylate cyclase